MDALDPEKLSTVETDDIRDRTEKFQGDGKPVDTEVRKQFSLNVQDEPAPRATQMREARSALAAADEDAPGGSKALVVFLVFVILGGLGAAAWFLFLNKS